MAGKRILSKSDCEHDWCCTANFCPMDCGTKTCGLREFVNHVLEDPRPRTIMLRTPRKSLMIDTDKLAKNTRLGQMVFSAKERKEKEDVEQFLTALEGTNPAEGPCASTQNEHIYTSEVQRTGLAVPQVGGKNLLFGG